MKDGIRHTMFEGQKELMPSVAGFCFTGQDACIRPTLHLNWSSVAVITWLIVDCGGGTTDLCACRFRVQDDSVAYHIRIDTAYPGGQGTSVCPPGR